MTAFIRVTSYGLTGALLFSIGSQAALRQENFDGEPSNWEGVNNRSTAFEVKTVVQNFGYSPGTAHAGGSVGEVGGRINPAGEPAFYGYRLPQAATLETPLSAEGRLLVAPGSSHALFGFFNTNTLNEWRTPNTMVLRINGRGDHFHCHFEYCTARWRAGAGVIGEIVPGERITAAESPVGKPCQWKLVYDPKGAGGRGVISLTLNGITATCEIEQPHRPEGCTFTHFGFLPVLKTWDGPGDMWIDDVKINGVVFDFSKDPVWDEFNNRHTYTTKDTRPRFDFGWSATHHAGGLKAGELGGLIFRGDCREPARMAAFGDRLAPLNLNTKLKARGKVAVLRAISDSTASIGFYHSKHSMQKNPSQKHSIPSDYLGINIEGPSSEAFFFYPVYRIHGDESAALGHNGGAPRIYPDRRVHDWFLEYDPDAADGKGRITVGLDNQVCKLDLGPGHKAAGATFDRFGICTPWIDGNSVTVYFDDLEYTASPLLLQHLDAVESLSLNLFRVHFCCRTAISGYVAGDVRPFTFIEAGLELETITNSRD